MSYEYIFLWGNHLPLVMYLYPSLDSKDFPLQTVPKPLSITNPTFFTQICPRCVLEKFGRYKVHYGYWIRGIHIRPQMPHNFLFTCLNLSGFWPNFGQKLDVL